MTSACPSLANMTGDPPYVLTVFLLAMPVKAATVVRRDDDARRVENMMMVLTVKMSVVVSLVVVVLFFVVVEIIAKDREGNRNACIPLPSSGPICSTVLPP